MRSSIYLYKHLAKPVGRSIAAKVPVNLEYNLVLPTGPIDPKPIILLHGLFGSKSNYTMVGHKLAKHINRPVYSLDLRNHGDSPNFAPFGYTTMAADVANFIAEHGLKHVTLVGHSMGAKVAMCVALTNENLVDRVVSVDNSPVGAGLGLNFTADLRGMTSLESSKSIKKSDKKWREKAIKYLEDYEPLHLVRLFLVHGLTNKLTKYNFSDSSIDYADDYVHFKCPVEAFAKHNVLEQIGAWPDEVGGKQFHKPALFLKARRSNFISEKTVSDIYRYFPGASLKTFDTGHWLISEDPDKFVKTLVEFIKMTETAD